VVSDAVDSAFLNVITDTGTTSTPSSGPEAANAKADLRAALLSIDAVSDQRLYWIASVDVAKKASTLASQGIDVVGSMSVSGGEMANLPCLVSSGVPALLPLKAYR
jgi:hypothetical protein